MTEVGRLVAGRYRLAQHIGSGAMGVVWQAHDERLHRTVALKQLLLAPGLPKADADEARERAMREGRIAARLQHPNAVTVYDVVEDSGQPVLIMEYVPSRSLSAVLDEQGSLPPQEVARIGQQVAIALVAAHAAGIVHRDIKPGNVLLADDGSVKITDFGISRATGDVTVTATGMLAGTPAYLAPEVAKGDVPGPPSDVFSLGSTLYAAVEGQPPFGHIENTLALLHAVAAGRTVPPRQAGPLTGPLGQMLAANPDDRPSMTDVSHTMGAIASGQVPPPLTGPQQRLGVGAPPGLGTTVRTRPGPPTPTGFRTPTPPGGSMISSGPLGPSGQLSASGQLGGPGSQFGPRPMANTGPASGGTQMAPMGQIATIDSPARIWRKRVITVLAIVVAALVGILVANQFTDTGNNSAAVGNTGDITSTSQPQVPVIAGQMGSDSSEPTTPATTTTTTTTTKAGDTGPISNQQMQATLSTFFSLLPANTTQAWQLLTPAEQQRYGGFGNFQKQWAQVSAVQLGMVLPHGNNSLFAMVSVQDNTGQTTSNIFIFDFARSNGSVLISNMQANKQNKHDN